MHFSDIDSGKSFDWEIHQRIMPNTEIFIRMSFTKVLLILGGFFILASALGGKSEISTDNWNDSDNDEDDYTEI